jgi:hypothetical protein
MRAYTISKMLTTRGINLNVPEVRAPFNYNEPIQQANEFLQRGDRKKALQIFKESMNASADISKVEDEKLKIAAAEGVKEELTMS